MKWLKKDSSPSEQATTAESQPEQGQAAQNDIEQANLQAPEALEQPDGKQEEASMQDAGDQAPNSEGRVTGRRRQRRQSSEEGAKDERKRFGAGRFPGATWVGQHWKTFAILAVLFSLAFFARAYYGLDPATEDGFILSGGSDSYYHHFVITYGTDTGDFHFWDNMLNYPVGTRNPRPPFYDWSVALMGMGMSPFFDGDVYTSTFYAFIFSTALWGALTVFPTYFLAKEAFGKRAGIIAAFLLAIMPGHVQRSVLTNADHDAITLFFIVTAILFFLKALKSLKGQEWITDWTKPKAALGEVRTFLVGNRIPVLYAMLSGLSIAGVALIWQGFAYVIVLIALYFFVQILLNRFRNVDSFGEFAIFFITIGVGLLLAFPYYYQSIQIPSWFDTPAYLFLGLAAFALILMATRKYPWFLVFSSIALLAVASSIALKLFAPSVLDTLVNALLSGGGYFINNKQYQTIAEAQAPPFSNLALSFGIFTFWLSFVGVAWAAIQLPKSWKPDFTFVLLWAGTSIYMAVTAARFMFNASPAFAIAAGWIIAIIIEKLNLRQSTDMMKRFAMPNMTNGFKVGLVLALAMLLILAIALISTPALAYPLFVIGIVALCGVYMLNLIAQANPNRAYSLITVLIPFSGAMFYLYSEFYSDWVFTEATHAFILAALLASYFVLYIQVRKVPMMFTAGVIFLAFCVVVPNVWSGLDAGIPYETKDEFDEQIYNSMPIFMQPEDYDNQTTWYIGGFGYSLPLNSNYYPAAYDWLATQDVDITPAHDRPAYLSWWDYGFEAVNEGQHPTVADNFLGGHQLAGNVLMAQSEDDVIALVCVRILEGDHNKVFEGVPNSLSPDVITLLESYGIDAAQMTDILENPGDYIDVILANPDKYGPRDENMQDANAKYIAARTYLTDTLDTEGLVGFYNDLSTLTGHSVRYFAVDTRLFPFSAQNTGIFYAPAKLSDHRIDDSANQPYDFWEIKAVGEYGGEYDLDEIPPDVNLNQDEPYKIVYKEMFYDSMLYRTFIGYSGSDIGQAADAGIPGYSGDLASNQIMPGWNMTHFKLVHRTAYWNPYPAEEIQNHTDAWQAMNYWDAQAKQEAGEGISDLSDRSSIYQGVMMLKYYHGAIISGKVTLEDGTPIQDVSVTVSDDMGIPHQRVVTDASGQYSIIAPFGDITLKASTGTVDGLTLVGTNEMNVTSMFIEDYQAMRENEDRDSDGKPDYLISKNLVIKSGGLTGRVYWDIDANGAADETDEAVSGAIITLSNSELPFKTTVIGDSEGAYSATMIPPGKYNLNIVYANRSVGTQEVTVSGGTPKTSDIPIDVSSVSGTVQLQDRTLVPDAIVRLWNQEEKILGFVVSDDNGTYKFDNIVYGDYFAQAYSEELGYASTVTRVKINVGANNTLNFTMYSSKAFEGTVTAGSMPAPYATIKLTGQTSVITKANSDGKFSVALEDGIYTYSTECYIDGTLFASAGSINLYEDIELDIKLQPGTMVSGKLLNYKGLPEDSNTITFENTDTGTVLTAITDDQGDYSIGLQQASYLVQVSQQVTGSYYSVHRIAGKAMILNITTKAGELLGGSVFWDVNKNKNQDLNEQIYMAKVTFEDPSGNRAVAHTDEGGLFEIVLPTLTPYKITVSRDGFQTASPGTFTHSDLSNGLRQALEVINIPVMGTIYLDGEPLTGQNIRLRFVSLEEGMESAEIQVARDGTFSGIVTPGDYRVTFIQNVTDSDDSEVFEIRDDIYFDTGLYYGYAISLQLEAVQRSKVRLSLTNADIVGANVSFRFGPEDRYFDIQGTSDDYYIAPGDYVISTYHAENETIWLDMRKCTVLENGTGTVPITLQASVPIQGFLKYQDDNIPEETVTFRDLATNGTLSVKTDDTGQFDISLIPGHRYEAKSNFVNFVSEPYTVAYRFYSEGMIIDADSVLPSYTITLSKDEYETELRGYASSGGAPSANTEMTFISGFGNYTSVTNSTGWFTVSLPPSDYTVYAHNELSNDVYLKQIGLDIENEDLEFGLVDGHRVYGTAYYDFNQKAQTHITFYSHETGSNMTILTDEAGYYQTWLPEGSYDIAGAIVAPKNGADVTFSILQTIDLSEDKQLNLALSMKEERIVFVSVDPTQLRETPANTTVRYTFDVENLGNIKDTYLLSATGGDPDWTTEPDVTSVTLDPNEKVTVPISIYIPATARTDFSSVSVTAVSQRNASVKHTNSINCIIIPEYGLSIEPVSASPTFAQGDISSKFSVVNDGNTADKYTLYIGNKEDLAMNGWEATLGSVDGASLKDDATRIVNVSVGYGTNSEVPLILTPTIENPSRQVSVLITGFSQGDAGEFDSQYIVLKYPALTVTAANLTATGMDVSEEAAGDQLVNITVMVVSVASALAVFYYARKRRWIR